MRHPLRSMILPWKRPSPPTARRFRQVVASAVVIMATGVCVLVQAQENRPRKPPAENQLLVKQRLIVLTDIEADPDDTESLVRLLLYSSEIDIRGLIATTSTFQKDRVAPDSIRRLIGIYGEVRPNLLLHESGYPPAEDLLRRVKAGLPLYGLAAVGMDKDSSGSDAILEELRRPDSRPLWIAAWGGTTTLAQALWKIHQTEAPAEAARLIARLRVYAISDQDDTGAWIRREFPALFYICSPGPVFRNATWTGITGYFPEANNDVISPEWLATNIQQGHGALGAAYPDVAYGMEGDTPSFLSLIPSGLSDPEHPNFGGWGGRYALYKPAFAVPEGWKPAGQNTVLPRTRDSPPLDEHGGHLQQACAAASPVTGAAGRYLRAGHTVALARRLSERLRRTHAVDHEKLCGGKSSSHPRTCDARRVDRHLRRDLSSGRYRNHGSGRGFVELPMVPLSRSGYLHRTLSLCAVQREPAEPSRRRAQRNSTCHHALYPEGHRQGIACTEPLQARHRALTSIAQPGTICQPALNGAGERSESMHRVPSAGIRTICNISASVYAKLFDVESF